MSWLTDEAREKIRTITAGLSQVQLRSSSTKTFRFNGEQVVETHKPSVVPGRSMFPYRSVQMAVDPSEVPAVSERLRKEGIFVEFDRAGCPIIESAKQCSDLATALGMKTGRDGYGHTDELGRFHNSGRRRADEVAAGRAKVRRAINTLETMPEDSTASAVNDVLREYDIVPSEDNTG